MVAKDNEATSLVAAIDAGTRTVKFCVFQTGHSTELVGHAVDVAQLTPQEGWLEVDPREILEAIVTCVTVVSEEIQKFGNNNF